MSKGYNLERGERGSSAEHLSVLEFKAQQRQLDAERAAEMTRLETEKANIEVERAQLERERAKAAILAADEAKSEVEVAKLEVDKIRLEAEKAKLETDTATSEKDLAEKELGKILKNTKNSQNELKATQNELKLTLGELEVVQGRAFTKKQIENIDIAVSRPTFGGGKGDKDKVTLLKSDWEDVMATALTQVHKNAVHVAALKENKALKGNVVELKEENEGLRRGYASMEGRYKSLQQSTQPYVDAKKYAPNEVDEALSEIWWQHTPAMVQGSIKDMLAVGQRRADERNAGRGLQPSKRNQVQQSV